MKKKHFYFVMCLTSFLGLQAMENNQGPAAAVPTLLELSAQAVAQQMKTTLDESNTYDQAQDAFAAQGFNYLSKDVKNLVAAHYRQKHVGDLPAEHRADITNWITTPDQTLLIGGDNNLGKYVVYNLTTGQRQCILERSQPHPENVIVVSPDKSRVAIQHKEDYWIWNLQDGQLIASFSTENQETFMPNLNIPRPAFTPDNKNLIVYDIGTESILIVALVNQPTSLHSLPLTDRVMEHMSVSPDGRLIAALTEGIEHHEPTKLSYWRLNDDPDQAGQLLPSAPIDISLDGRPEYIQSISEPSKDDEGNNNKDEIIMVAGEARMPYTTMTLVDTRHQQQSTFNLRTASGIVFSRDNETYCHVDPNNPSVANVYYMQTDEQRCTVNHGEEVTRVNLSYDGTKLITASNRRITVWEVETGIRLYTHATDVDIMFAWLDRSNTTLFVRTADNELLSTQLTTAALSTIDLGPKEAINPLFLCGKNAFLTDDKQLITHTVPDQTLSVASKPRRTFKQTVWLNYLQKLIEAANTPDRNARIAELVAHVRDIARPGTADLKTLSLNEINMLLQRTQQS